MSLALNISRSGLGQCHRPWLTAVSLLIAAEASPARAALPLPLPPPLFRLALEQWIPANYQVLLFHHEPLDVDDVDLLTQLREAPARTGANVEVVTVDLSTTMSDRLQSLWRSQTNAEPPWMVVRAPGVASNPPVIWAGHLSPPTVATLLSSPARRTVAAALLRGEAAAWVLIECGNTLLDENAVDQLASSLKTMEQTLRPPTPAGISFSLVRVTRTDPAEEFLITSLIHGAALPARPAVFAVFGRGHFTEPLVGKRITAKSIQQLCKRLTGPYARDSNDPLPARVLLLAARWAALFPQTNAAAPPGPVAALSTPVSAPSDPAPPVSRAFSPPEAAPASPEHRLLRPWSIAAGILLLSAAIYLLKKKGSRT